MVRQSSLADNEEKAGPFMLDVGISSTMRIAASRGLVDAYLKHPDVIKPSSVTSESEQTVDKSAPTHSIGRRSIRLTSPQR